MWVIIARCLRLGILYSVCLVGPFSITLLFAVFAHHSFSYVVFFHRFLLFYSSDLRLVYYGCGAVLLCSLPFTGCLSEAGPSGLYVLWAMVGCLGGERSILFTLMSR